MYISKRYKNVIARLSRIVDLISRVTRYRISLPLLYIYIYIHALTKIHGKEKKKIWRDE